MVNGTRNFWQILAGAVLGLLGFASCGKIANIIDAPDMYGQPHADFKALGSVTDENGKPVEGIRVAIQRHRHFQDAYNNLNWYDHDTLFTDEKGGYLLDQTIDIVPDDVKIVFDDIDGEENGGDFASAEATPEIVRTKKGDNEWYDGAFEVKADVRLKKR